MLTPTGWVTVAPPMCFVGGVLTDIVGRRPVILVGVTGCCICLIVEACAVKYFTPERQGLGKLGVAALYLFNGFYNPSMDDAANIYYAEVFPNHIRGKGVALTNLVLALADLVYLQVTPYAFANIGWKYFLVSAFDTDCRRILTHLLTGLYMHLRCWCHFTVLPATRVEGHSGEYRASLPLKLQLADETRS